MSDTKITITIKLTIKSIEFELTKKEALELMTALEEALGPYKDTTESLMEKYRGDSVPQLPPPVPNIAPPAYFIDRSPTCPMPEFKPPGPTTYHER